MKQKGFTLIELLVVISIIGLLASVVLVALNGARMKARDAKRKADLRQIETALTLYYNDNSSYPVMRWATSGITTYDDGTKFSALQAALAPYMPKLPKDPLNQGVGGPWTNGNYQYAYGSDGRVYDLVAQLENRTDKSLAPQTCWLYHEGEGPYAPELPWSAACGGGGIGLSNFIYADH